MHQITKAYKVEHFNRISRERDRLDFMFAHLVNNDVAFGEWAYEAPGWNSGNPGRYRVGIAGSRAYRVAMVVFRVKGQQDSVSVYDLDTWEQELPILRSRSECWEPNCVALASALKAYEQAEAKRVAA